MQKYCFFCQFVIYLGVSVLENKGKDGISYGIIGTVARGRIQ